MGWWSGSGAILIAAIAAIIGIGVIGAKRGVKLMLDHPMNVPKAIRDQKISKNQSSDVARGHKNI